MRWVFACVLSIGAALSGHAQEAKELEVGPDGGFTPRGAGFRVTFELANMRLEKPEPAVEPQAPTQRWPAREWTSAQGGVARLKYRCVQRPVGIDEVTLAVVRLSVSNPTDHSFQTTLSVAIRPRDAIYALAFDRHAFQVERRWALVADTPSRGAILADSPFARRPLSPQAQAHVESAKGECRGEMVFDLTLEAGKTQALGFICPVRVPPGRELDLDFYRGLSVEELWKGE